MRPGYTGGWLHNPTGVHIALDFTGMWQCVVSHTSCVHTARTGHAMAVEVTYDPAEVSYGDLCQLFSNNRNPNLNTAEHRKQAWNGSMYAHFLQWRRGEEGGRILDEPKQRNVLHWGRRGLSFLALPCR